MMPAKRMREGPIAPCSSSEASTSIIPQATNQNKAARPRTAARAQYSASDSVGKASEESDLRPTKRGRKSASQKEDKKSNSKRRVNSKAAAASRPPKGYEPSSSLSPGPESSPPPAKRLNRLVAKVKGKGRIKKANDDDVGLLDIPDDDSEEQTLDALIDFIEMSEQAPTKQVEVDEHSLASSDEALGQEDIDFEPTPLSDGLRKDVFVFVKYPSGYFISQFLAYEPAKTLKDKEAGKDFCTIMDANGKVHEKVKMDRIITKDDPRIADCKLGKYKLLDNPSLDFTSDADVRPPTPDPERLCPITTIPSLPTPSPTQPQSTTPSPSEFNDLDRISQLRHIRPHLQAVLEEKYEPGQWRIDKFFGSNKERHMLNNEVSYGDIVGNEVIGVILPELWRWALRKDRWPDKDKRPEEPHRPRGSERYNSLSLLQLKEYIDNVLLPEAIIQLCIRSYDPEDLLREADEMQAEDQDEDAELLADVSDPELDDEADSEDEGGGAGAIPAVSVQSSQARPATQLTPPPDLEAELSFPPPMEGSHTHPPSLSISSSLLSTVSNPPARCAFASGTADGDSQSAPNPTPTPHLKTSPAPRSEPGPTELDNSARPPSRLVPDLDLGSKPTPSPTHSPSPTPTPTPGSAVHPPPGRLDPIAHYDAARALLRILASRDISQMWSTGEFFLHRARETKRRELGLLPENMSREELRQWNIEKAWEEEKAGGRRRMSRVRSFKDM